LTTLTKLGFVQVPDYNYTKVLNWKVLRSWIDTVSKKVEIHPEYLARLEEDVANWKAGKTMEKFAQGLASAQRKNFLLAQKVPLQKGLIKPYLVSHNHKVFLCLNDKVNMATFPRVKAATVSGVSWKKVTGEHWMFATSKQQAQTVVKELFAKFDIINRKELVKQFADVRVVKTNGK
jgi:C1A family cysteine protease